MPKCAFLMLRLEKYNKRLEQFVVLMPQKIFLLFFITNFPIRINQLIVYLKYCYKGVKLREIY